MPLRISIVVVCLFWSSASLGQAKPPGPLPDALTDPAQTGAAACAAAKLAALRDAPPAPPIAELELRDTPEETDVLHYDLDLEIDPNQRWLDGHNVMTVRSLVDGLSTFHIRLSSAFTVSNVTVNDAPAGWTRIDSATLEVTLDPPVAADETFTVGLDYAGYPNSVSTWGSITFDEEGGRPVAYSLSEPWYAYTWRPAKDDLRDKSTADLWFTVPSPMIVASNGVLEGVDALSGDRLRYRWRTDYPTADYLFSFAAAEYATFDDTWEYAGQTMPLEFFIWPSSDTTSRRNAWLKVGDMLTTYSDLFGVYPFADEKYGMAQFGFGGGMEHQTITSQGGFWEYVTAHELSHQWWGDNVTCATWNDIWLNEGFATYSEALWFENGPGGGGLDALHSWMDVRKPSNASGTVYVYDTSNPDRIFSLNLSYLKGAWVLHMLRYVVGDTAFFDILAAYREAFEGSAATTEDFRAVAESVYGDDLSWFFDEWVYGGQALKHFYAVQPRQSNGQFWAEVYVRQQIPGAPAFRMPLEIETVAAGEATRWRIWNESLEQHVLLPVGAALIDSVTLDPDNWILELGAPTATTWQEGPPKIVAMSPAPGSSVDSTSAPSLSVVFHEDVQAAAADFTLVGPDAAPVATDFAYDPATLTATLTAQGSVLPGEYTLIVADTITDVASGQALDGEIPGLLPGRALPSGDGQPGGDAVATFTVLPRLGDLNCDGTVDFFDIDGFLVALQGEEAYAERYPGCNRIAAGDTDGDGTITFFDIPGFLEQLAH